MALQPNDSVGPYLLLRTLGKGAFGEVWLARHHDLGVERALKVPTDPDCVSQLRNEGRIQFQLDHPNIVRTLELNTADDPSYYVMEYVAGVTLRQKLRATGKLALVEALPILRQILLALEHAHGEGVLHCDLKPENVLLQADGTVKVADFGFGKMRAEAAQSILLSGSMIGANGTSIAGTVDYMSPQQKAPEAGDTGDPRDDLYAVGVIACELLTGSRPQAVGVTKMLQRVGVDVVFAPMLEKALEQERFDRYGNAREMLTDIEMRAAARPGTPTAGVSSSTQHRSPSPLPTGLPRNWAGQVWTNTVGMKFAYIPAGRFDMGSPKDEAERRTDETLHRVTISKPFLIGMHLVTRGEFAAFIRDSSYKTQAEKETRDQFNWRMPGFEHDDEHPVVWVSWNDAQACANWLREKERMPYRLPTESQWEYACRAGTTTPFHFGPTLSTDQANYDGNHVYGLGRKGVYRQKTTRVGTFPPNSWGLYDMHGNAWEWCADWFAVYPAGNAVDPVGSAVGTSRVLRGGSWCNDPRICRSAFRGGFAPDDRYCDIGIRLCMDL